VFPVLHCVNLLTGFKSKRRAARRPYRTPTWERRLSHRPYLHSRTGGLTMRITTEKSVTPKFRYAQITESRLSRRPRDTMNQSGSRPHKLSRPPGPLQVCYSCVMRGVQRADGSFFSDTYTEVELVRCALWCLQKFSGTQHVYIGLRDAAMLLFSTTTAVRGGSSRILRWSDLFMSEIPMDDVRLGKKVPVSCECHLPTA